ncbi:glycosyltransferase involved in cell wall biosynthesis [Algoriphagus aquaeductus]|uniref:Glycosyltransferase involved in cell wall biosynthesis n=1 Tax=Algoriphagus aquaeductus TaxID=475299 RepID=A0A326RJZ4_9BACT|nr:glycosyltransferase [Algoriphagus aquaeductus]PZV76009.1 glycosyltransferase involved in cell wall biosynthesis [Algoriphagus aquaeductus]
MISDSCPKRIKVLHLIKSLGRGGAEKLIPETALVHDQNKFEFHCLYFYHQDQNILDELQAAGIQTHLIPAKNLELFFKIKKVKHFVLEQGFDIIHAHLPWAGILARFVGKELAIPIVYTEHNTWERYNKISYLGNRFTFKHQDVAIAVSNEVALSMRLNSIWDPYRRGGRLKVIVVQNGVNTEVFRRKSVENERIEIGRLGSGILGGVSLRERLGIPENACVIGKVAVFRSQKRLWLWVELAMRILKTCPETHFLLVGDGEWRERILSQVKKSGLEKNFHWVGVQKNVVPYLSLMDIYLSTSEFEGLPIAMLEAMSCEVPIVSTRAGGIGEVIQHGKQGFLTEIEEWEELEGYCIQLLQNPELQKSMAQAARDRVIEKFSMRRMVSELERIYTEVIEVGK